MTIVKKSFEFGGQTVTLETGRIARQASGAVMVSMGKTQLLATVVAKNGLKPGQDFFPLSVHYQEKTYAAGRIPGGYFKREGRPTETETLVSRLCDRPIRPLFPKGFMNEVQVILTVMSAEPGRDADIIAMIGQSAALAVSGIPFNGPIGAAKVGFSETGEYILNPSRAQLETSRLEMVVAGTADAVLMVESEAEELTEDQMLGAVLFAHEEIQETIEVIKAFAAEADIKPFAWTPPAEDKALAALVAPYAERVAAAYRVTDKMERYAALGAIRSEATAELVNDTYNADDIGSGIAKLEKNSVREAVLNGEPRIDGRDLTTVRGIDVEVGVLDQTHGSALFTRGETQAIVAATLGTLKDSQHLDTLHGHITDRFMLHYNFPPFSVGEAGFMGGPKRREIGHGRLARRGVQAVLPSEEDFPYALRVVSEITESNGSSSMASVCGTSLALMDAGVPLRAPVAGIAMGLVKDGERFAVLTDILGDEDHLGDMDFKVAGTAEGVTALQMDIKIEGINEEIMEKALQQACTARLHILDEMNKVLKESRTELAATAPRMSTMKIDSDKIRDVIGKGGSVIRDLTEKSGASIDLDDDGTVRIYAASQDSADLAKQMILAITAEAEVGTVYEGLVARIVDFGAFVTILPGKDGLVHISQISEERVEKVTDYLSEGQTIKVKVLDVDARGRIKLSMRDLEAE
ncbi:polyribonucleotide nucleotidyltransferase [Litorivicinus lipolyticus]|uniref:Polyribonucleotide nucleotidyltransferase n=1 Tax=Litorivicinus lipolyticus TaxID=418701 RepID=A0A5Q2Q6M7_9GAMM|nr:polyribonucleotide nucleotidyltransferase [Litorivicinus lipolyticus]QGG79488.1 polyribonucleotide nucleotidyltransferase [Litorivicinus lipolyticus]